MLRPGLLALPFLVAFSPAFAAAPPANAPYLPGFHAATAPPAAPAPAPPTAPAASAPMSAPLAAPVTASDSMAAAAQAVSQQQARPALRALGQAETRLLSRSVPLFQTDTPSANPAVTLIDKARAALRAGDLATAATLIAQATPLVARQQNAPPPSPPVGLPSH